MNKSKDAIVRAGRNTAVVVVSVTSALVFFCQAAHSASETSQEQSGLKIYLPREVSVAGSELNLGQLGIVRGEKSLVARASAIAMGQISVPGQSIVIDRTTVLSRLASSGIPASQVTLTGAEQMTIRQQNRIVSAEELVSLANAFLENNRPSTSASRWAPVRMPESLLLPGLYNDVRFSPQLSESNATNQVRVEIAVFAAGRKIAVRDVQFCLKYDCRQAVTKTDIAAGQVLGPENVEIQTRESNYPEPADWTSPYGLVAKHRLSANTLLRPNMVGVVQSPTVIARNQTVAIRIERPGLLITAAGKAMEDGKAGEFIKVRNVDSQRVILVKINADGSVEPVL